MPRSRRQASPNNAGDSNFRAKVRMYTHGLGDCFLITLPRKDAERDKFFVMIDCGVILGTQNAAQKMAAVVDDIAATTDNRVDLLLATHEHWDHVSGFKQAEENLKRITFGEVWLAWTEDPNDEFAKQLGKKRSKAVAALRMAEPRLRMAEASDSADEVGSMLAFFGARGDATKEALEIVRRQSRGRPPRYCRPGEDPVRFDGVAARFYVLGPPQNLKLLAKLLPSKRDPETYGLTGTMFLADQLSDSLAANEDPDGPFGPLQTIPRALAKEMDFFKQRYWGMGPAVAGDGDAWRRIDTAWFEGASELALQLDSETNNTSLVIAIELADQDVLLFAADAQIGNWLSWQDLLWKVGDRTVTGPDLLKRTVLYKVGHHGSHNATLRDKGLELMQKLNVAMLPVDTKMAGQKNWDHMPLPDLVEALKKKTGRRVVQSDRPAPEGMDNLVRTDLYYELTL
jgi:hypothetical protein